MARTPQRRPPRSGPPSSPLERLARFRYEIRRFLRFSENAAREAAVTPMQHQLLLGAAGFTGRGWATVSELAEFLQLRHNAVVELAKRAEAGGLVRKRRGPDDRRVIRVLPTARGRRLLEKLSGAHVHELRRIRTHLGGLVARRPQVPGGRGR